MESIVAYWSVHTPLPAISKMCVQICAQMYFRVLCELGPMNLRSKVMSHALSMDDGGDMDMTAPFSTG